MKNCAWKLNLKQINFFLQVKSEIIFQVTQQGLIQNNFVKNSWGFWIQILGRKKNWSRNAGWDFCFNSIRDKSSIYFLRNHITKDRGVCSYGVNLELAEDDFSTVGEGLSVTLLEKIVRTWYNQKQYYNYETGKSEGEERIDDFCQMIWKPCSKLGVAISEKESLLIIYVLFNSGE